MTTEQLAGLPKWLDLDRLADACEPYGADPHKVIAYALSEVARLDAKENGMTLKEQARLAWSIVEKANPSQQAIKHSGDETAPFVIHYSRDDEKL